MSQTINNTQDIIDRQAALLEAFSRVQHVLGGTEAHLWLPGVRSRFSGPRKLGRIRPPRVGLEVLSGGGLVFHGAFARPRRGKLVFDTVFRYDLTRPMRERARGDVLSVKNEVLAHRALGLLSSLVQFGERKDLRRRASKAAMPKWPRFLVPFNPGEEQYAPEKLEALSAGMLPELAAAYRSSLCEELTDRRSVPGSVLVDSSIVPTRYVEDAINRALGFEDYEPILGMPHWNPVRGLREQPNPAAELLATHGVKDLETLDQGKLDELAAAFRSRVLLGERFSDDDIYDALVHPEAEIVSPTSGFAGIAPTRLVAAMRKAAGESRAARDASDSDLLKAAFSGGPLVISCLSITQICSVEDLQDVPAPYAGSVLPPLDWQPPRARVAVAA